MPHGVSGRLSCILRQIKFQLFFVNAMGNIILLTCFCRLHQLMNNSDFLSNLVIFRVKLLRVLQEVQCIFELF